MQRVKQDGWAAEGISGRVIFCRLLGRDAHKSFRKNSDSPTTQQIQAQLSVVVARTVMELNGIACLSIEEIAPDKQQIVCFRNFRHAITSLIPDDGDSAVCARAAESSDGNNCWLVDYRCLFAAVPSKLTNRTMNELQASNY